MPRKGKKWIDPKKATKFRLVHRSYDDPRYGDSESSVRILAPVENPNIARKRMPDEHYEQKEKLIELVESYNQASIDAAEGNNAAEAYSDDDDDDDEYEGDRGAGEEGEEEEEVKEASQRHRRDRAADLDDARFADADEDEDEDDEEDEEDDLPPLEEDERKKAPAAQKSGVVVKDVKGKGKAKPSASSKEFELGEYGFETDYDYGQHFKPMGTAGAVFMEAPTGKKGQKGQKQPAFALREDVERQRSAKIVTTTTEVIDFMDDADMPEEVPEDLLEALNDPEAFESLTDDFVIAAEDLAVDGSGDQDEAQDAKSDRRKGQRKVRFDEHEEEEEEGEGDEEDEHYYGGEEDEDEEDEDDEDLEALLKGLKANPEGDKRRERNEYEQVFDARFEKALAEFDDDEIGELDEESEQIRGMTTMDQLRPVLKEFISSRRRVKGIIGKADETTATKSQRAASQAGSVKGHESEGERDGAEGQEEEEEGAEGSDDEELVLADAEEPRDQWDCESITTTYTNTENHPRLIDDAPLRAPRRPPIVLSKKTGIPLGVLPTKPAKGQQAEVVDDASVNKGQARPRAETKEEKRARKQQIKEARKANRERKKEMKGAFKEEELRQLSMQAKGQGQRVIRLK